MNQKTILDATCGSRSMWFDKNNNETIYCDIRYEDLIDSKGNKIEVKPDLVMDFRSMPFDDNKFNIVILDPPHIIDIQPNSDLCKKYGFLLPTWEADITAGINECIRVLKPGGILIFKWSEVNISVQRVLHLVKYKPLFGHTTGKRGLTKWIVFMKHSA